MRRSCCWRCGNCRQKKGPKPPGSTRPSLQPVHCPAWPGLVHFSLIKIAAPKKRSATPKAFQAILRQGSKDDVRRAQEMLSGGHGELSGRLDTHAGELSGAASRAQDAAVESLQNLANQEIGAVDAKVADIQTTLSLVKSEFDPSLSDAVVRLRDGLNAAFSTQDGLLRERREAQTGELSKRATAMSGCWMSWQKRSFRNTAPRSSPTWLILEGSGDLYRSRLDDAGDRASSEATDTASDCGSQVSSTEGVQDGTLASSGEASQTALEAQLAALIAALEALIARLDALLIERCGVRKTSLIAPVRSAEESLNNRRDEAIAAIAEREEQALDALNQRHEEADNALDTLTTESVNTITETGERERTLVEEEGTTQRELTAETATSLQNRLEELAGELGASLEEVAEREQGELRDAIDKGKESLDTAAQAAVDALNKQQPGGQ